MSILTPERAEQIRESLAFAVYEAVLRHFGLALVPMVGYAPASQRVAANPMGYAQGPAAAPAGFYGGPARAPAVPPAPFDVALPGGGSVRLRYAPKPYAAPSCCDPNCTACNPTAPVDASAPVRPAEMDGMPLMSVVRGSIESSESGDVVHRFYVPGALTANVLRVELSAEGPAPNTGWLTVYVKTTAPELVSAAQLPACVVYATLVVPRDLSRVWVSVDEAESAIVVKVNASQSTDVTRKVFNGAAPVS